MVMMEVEQHSWPAQSPNLNIFESLLGILEKQVRKHFSPPASHSDLATVLQEEWLNILLAFWPWLKNLYLSFPRWIAPKKEALHHTLLWS